MWYSITQVLIILLFTISTCLLIYLNMVVIGNVSQELLKRPEVLDINKFRFEGYLKDFNKRYEGEEYDRRFENFKASLKDIARLNKLEGNTVFGLTKFSDMSKEEFVERMLMKPDTIGSCRSREKECVRSHSINGSTIRYVNDVPENFDWRTKGVVKPVVNQKLCQGCWAFSIVGVMESMSAIRGLDHDSRSIQELIDCSKYNNGCKRGNVNSAMDYLCTYKLNIVTDDQYPLTLADDMVCKLKARSYGRRIKKFWYQCNLDEDVLVRQIASHGPLIAAVDASNWMNYIGGVIQRACSRGVSNHVIQIVGYNGYRTEETETNIPYYWIRNSYGQDFGDDGYVKIAINDNVCGIADQVTRIDVI